MASTPGPNANIDVLVGGTPCQSFSVAGLRAGLADPRGNLALVYLAIAARYRPRWVVWENVPGVLSSDGGRAFGSFIGGLGELGYGYAWRVFDAQYFGLAQRRKRVFVVGCLGSWARAAAVLFEPSSLRGDSAPRRETRENVAGSLTQSAARRSADDPERGGLISFGGNNTSGPLEVSTAVNAKGGSGRMDFESETLLCFDETQITSAENRCKPRAGDPSHPLSSSARPPTIAFDCKAGGDTGHGSGHAAVAIQAGALRENPLSGPDGVGVQSDLAYTIEARAEVQAVQYGYGVRRLTPRECERLQGFPDDFTLIEYRGKPAADGPRYKALGNSMAVPVMRWLGERIELIDGQP